MERRGVGPAGVARQRRDVAQPQAMQVRQVYTGGRQGVADGVRTGVAPSVGVGHRADARGIGHDQNHASESHGCPSVMRWISPR